MRNNFIKILRKFKLININLGDLLRFRLCFLKILQKYQQIFKIKILLFLAYLVIHYNFFKLDNQNV